MEILQRMTFETARAYATRTIKYNIIQMGLLPGEMISEKDVATSLGLSRTPVREALIDLSNVGIVEILPQKGCRIALLNHDLVAESRFMRLAMEKAVIEILCSKTLTSSQITSLGENLQLQKFHLQSHSPDNPLDRNRLIMLDDQFHRLLFTFANRELSHSIVKNFDVHFDRVRYIYTNHSLNLDSNNVEDHANLAQYIIDKDLASARNLIDSHLSRCQTINDYVNERYPQFIAK